MAPGNKVREDGQAAVDNRRPEVEQALGAPTLLAAAQQLGVIGAGNEDEAAIVQAMTPAQQDQVRDAVLDALQAGRRVRYVCDIANPPQLLAEQPGPGTKLNVAVTVGSDETRIEFTPV